MVWTAMDAVDWYVSFWKGVLEMRVGTFVFALGMLGFMLFVVPALSRAEEPAQAPPIDPRFSVRLESAEARLTEAEAKIDDLAKQLEAVKQAACECATPTEKASEKTPPVALPIEKPTTTKATRTVCGPNGCYEVESNPFAAPRASYGSCSDGSCGVQGATYKRGLFGKWRRAR